MVLSAKLALMLHPDTLRSVNRSLTKHYGEAFSFCSLYDILLKRERGVANISLERLHMGAYRGQRLGDYQLTLLLAEGRVPQVYLLEHIVLRHESDLTV